VPADAGFALVGSVSEKTVNQILGAYFANLVSPITFSLPASVIVGGSTINISGSLILLPPLVTLKARSDNLVNVQLGLAGQLTLNGGPQPGQYELELTCSVDVGLVTNVSGSNFIVGLDTSAATINSVNVYVMTGTPLNSIYSASLNSQTVLNALTSGLRSIPPSLLQTTLPIPTSLTKQQTYGPPPTPKGMSIFPGTRTLFSVNIPFSRVVVKPLDSALVIALDLQGYTNGNSAALADINKVNLANTVNPTSISFYLSGSVLTQLIANVVAPQMANNYFITNNVQLGQFSLGVGPLLGTGYSGIVITADFNLYSSTIRDKDGFVEPDPKDPSISDAVSVQVVTDLSLTKVSPIPSTQYPFYIPPGENTAAVTFSTNPSGGYMNLPTASGGGSGPNGSYVTDGGSITLAVGSSYSIAADTNTFQAWSTSGGVTVDDSTSPQTTLNVNGNGTLTLQTTAYDPLVTADFWSSWVPFVDITLPWWLDLAIFGLGLILPLQPLGLAAAFALIADIIPNAIKSGENQAAQQIAAGINNTMIGLPLLNPAQIVTQLPGIKAPNFWMQMVALGMTSDQAGIGAFMNIDIDDVTMSSIPYLLVTNRNVSDPSQVTSTNAMFPPFYAGSNPPAGYLKYENPSPTFDVHDGTISAVLKVPPGLFNPQDPSVYVTWTVQRGDTGQTILSKTVNVNQTGSPENIYTVTIDRFSDNLQSVDNFIISCRLYRLWGSNWQDLPAPLWAFEPMNITITDCYDRHHPYVWWQHWSFPYPGHNSWPFPVTRAEWLAGWKKFRTSRIHRTDVPGRCKMVDSLWGGGNRGGGPGGPRWSENSLSPRTLNDPWNYLDSLDTIPSPPFPPNLTIDKIKQDRELARRVLCDYCFYGGPNRKTLLI